MKKRKLVAMLLAMCMVFSLAACGNSGGSSSSSSTSSEGGDSGSAENSDDSASSGAETGSFDDVITLTADSDGDPFTWDPSTDFPAE